MQMHADWDQQVSIIQNLRDLSDAEKGRTIAGIHAIRDTLGPDWLTDARRCLIPLVPLFNNRLPWAQQFLARFGRQLERVRDCPNFTLVKQQLLDPLKFPGAAAQIRMASRSVSAGFSASFEPELGHGPEGKRADLLIHAAPEHFIEIKTLGQSRETQRLRRTLDEVSTILWRFVPEISSRGKVHKYLSKRRLDDLAARVASSVEQLRSSDRDVRLVIDRVCDITLSKSCDSSPRLMLECPDPESTLIQRICNTIQDKSKHQLPSNSPSILAIECDDVNMGPLLGDGASYLVDAIEETLFDQSHVIALLLLSSWTGGGIPHQSDHGHFRTFQHISYDLCAESGIVRINDFSRFPVRSDVIDALIRSDD